MGTHVCITASGPIVLPVMIAVDMFSLGRPDAFLVTNHPTRLRRYIAVRSTAQGMVHSKHARIHIEDQQLDNNATEARNPCEYPSTELV